MNRIYFGDNLPILKAIPNESVDLIYIDPPFNTGKTQKHTAIRTIRSEDGDRKGFQGNTYKTIELGTRAFTDSYGTSFESFLRPRLEEAHRLLKPHGSLYFHIDYREVHYCKILLDEIFGRDCFLNEIIWAYDYGGRAKSKWPAKHDNILYYVKNPKNYIFNTSEIDREEYLAPGLVGVEKAKLGKTPTDTWYFKYVGKKQYIGKKTMDTWWQTIVPTNSKERLGYPTQKPRKLIDRIIKASSFRGSEVLDFFAGSGTTGSSCIDLGRNFTLIDNNKLALEVMAERFSGINDIEWIGFDPAPYQGTVAHIIPDTTDSLKGEKYHLEFEMLAAMASKFQGELEDKSELWKGSPFEWILQFSARQKSTFGRQLVAAWCESKGLLTTKPKESSESLIINDRKISIKFSTLWTNGIYKFQQIRQDGYDYVLCFGISPNEAHCWIFDREYVIKNATQQHKGSAEYWIAINPKSPPEWVVKFGGNLEQAFEIIDGLEKN
jgi:site-specific DNA-methyltransferase (adenine-specific)